MIYVLTKDNVLYVFNDLSDLKEELKNISGSGACTFYDEDGQSLKPRPPSSFWQTLTWGTTIGMMASQDIELTPNEDKSVPSLLETLDANTKLSDNPFFTSMDQIKSSIVRALKNKDEI